MAAGERLAIVTELFSPSLGGQETRLGRFARGLTGRGRAVEVFTADHTGGRLPREEIVSGVPVHRYVALTDYVRAGSRSRMGLLRYARETARLVRRLGRAGWRVWLNEMPIAHLPFVRDPGNSLVDWCELPTSAIRSLVAERAARRFSGGTAVDETVARRLRGLAPGRPFTTVRTPVELGRYAPSTKEFGAVLYLGRLVPHKGLESLAKAVDLLRSLGWTEFRLDIAGDGPLRPRLEARFGLSGGIRFLGAVSEERKIDLLRRAWLVALPSRREGLPNAVLESIAAGTPVLTSDASGNGAAEFVRRHGIGVAVPTRPVERLAGAIRSLTPDRWEAFAHRASELRSELAWDLNLDRLEAVLYPRWAS
jgi:glycosyltransferase involved in cell wall biosynthesis